MALNLLRGGCTLSVFARQPARAAVLVESGAGLAASPAALAATSDIVCLNLSDDAAVAEVLFGSGGLSEGLRPDGLVIDFGTTSPTATRDFADRLAAHGVTFLDAPVSGGEAGAQAATLSIMVGGSVDDFQRAGPLLRLLGRTIEHVGPVGAGQVAKACNQIVVSATLVGVAEAIAFARHQGVDAGRVRDALLGGFAYSRILEVHGRRMLDGDFSPGFRTRLHQKDLGIVADEARRLGLGLPVSSLAGQLINALVGMGAAESDSAAVLRVIEALGGQLKQGTP